jgi:signal transduction histidine kinase/ligand-binding sensor domain-containing protein
LLVYRVNYTFPEVRALAEHDGALLIALNSEVKRIVNGTLGDYPLRLDERQLKATCFLRDRDGGLWIGTQDQGLLHVSNGRMDRFDRRDGLSGDFVTTLMEDQEGNVWAATLNGIDRFRAVAVTRMSRRQGLSSDSLLSVLTTRDGSVWFSTLDGLNQWKNGQVTRYGIRDVLSGEMASTLFEDRAGTLWVSSPRGRAYLKDGPFTSITVGDPGYGFVSAIAQDTEGSLWISEQILGLFQMRGRRVVRQIPWAELGTGPARALAADPVDGGIWLGFFQGGVSYLKEGRIQASFTSSEGLGVGKVSALLRDADGALWAATQGGLSRVKNGAVETLTIRNGLPCDTAYWVIDDSAGSLWLRTACGLVHIPRPELDAWDRDPDRVVRLTTYDGSDGLPDHSDQSSYGPTVARSADGRLWFMTYEGAAVIDPQQIPVNAIAPPVHIEQVAADGVTRQATAGLALPPLVRDLRIDYTAISLSAPEKVQFRYKLEGRDEAWIDAGNRRQAFYTDLPPNRYRFRVMAANEDGIWNETGNVWEFSILPTFYQTLTFRIAAFVGALWLLWAFYSVRLRRLAAQMNVRFEERLAERTRIAQDLHDTLLQGSLSASMQLHVLVDQVAEPGVRTKLERVVQRFSDMIDEGRRTVQDLRASPATADDLEQTLAREAEYLRNEQSTEIRVGVQGRKHPLHPLIRDECYRIAREALVNVFRHARATRVEVEVEYAHDHLRLRIRDNGRGVDPQTLEKGRPGHWGLLGMRERAAHIGATVKLSSRVNKGTEVELIVPGGLAFRSTAARSANGQEGPVADAAQTVHPSLTATFREFLPRLSLRWLATRLRL